jgi:hypothetical protein
MYCFEKNEYKIRLLHRLCGKDYTMKAYKLKVAIFDLYSKDIIILENSF